MSKSDKQLIELLKKSIKREARDFCINTPRITKFEIHQYKSISGSGATYENATCVVTDCYKCPITGEQKEDIYQCSYDGKLSYTYKQCAA